VRSEEEDELKAENWFKVEGLRKKNKTD